MKHSSISVTQLEPWCELNDVVLNGINIVADIQSASGESKGAGLVANRKHGSEDTLLSVSESLILSRESIRQCSKLDKDLRILLEAAAPFVQTPRRIIVIFLLYQMTLNDPDLVNLGIGVSGPFTSYYLTLPKQIPLPTFLSSKERQCQKGTSLAEAVDQKIASLHGEFARLKELTQDIEWCQKAWWNEATGRLSFHDWLLVDAIYRSRALDLPRGTGEAMVPILDMANHSGGDNYNARFEVGSDGRVLLLVREGYTIEPGTEITINYGAGGASEMLFSYGFLEENIESAREMYLSVRSPKDDPLWMAKMHLIEEPPGLRLFKDFEGRVVWDSDFVWWMCVNEEDGLNFELLQTTDGTRELRATFNGTELNPEKLKWALLRDERADVFRLRATVLIQSRVEEQGEILSVSRVDFEELVSCATQEEYLNLDRIRILRDLELKLLTESYDALEDEKQRLLTSRIVAEYLSKNSVVQGFEDDHSNGHEEEDFS